MLDVILVHEIHQVQQPGDDACLAEIRVTMEKSHPVSVYLGTEIAKLVRDALASG